MKITGKFLKLIAGLATLVCQSTALPGHLIGTGEKPSLVHGAIDANLTELTRHVRNIGRITRNDAFDKVYWDQMVGKGCALLAAMTDRTTAESIWSDPTDLAKWGYEEEEDAQKDWTWPMGGLAPMMEEALSAYGWDTKKDFEGGKNYCDGKLHSKETKHDNVEYLPTKAQFRTIINVQDGLITGWYKFGPSYAASRNPPFAKIFPRLKAWSDIAFLQYKDMALNLEKQGKARAPLRAIFSAQIVNSKTQSIVAAALAPADQRHETGIFDIRTGCKNIQWDNKRYFAMESEEGRALLGSENGRGAGMLLAQHKSWFGETTTIAGVTVWCSKPKARLNFMFHIAD